MKQAKMATDVFNRIIAATKNFCDSSSSRTVLQNIYFEFDSAKKKCTAIALDGYKMSVEHAIVDCEESFSVFVPPTIHLPHGKTAFFELHENELLIKCNELIFGMKQSEKSFVEWRNVIPKNAPVYTIAFNGDYLLRALQAAKASAGGSFNKQVILELREPLEAIVLKTNDEDIKLVLPLRINKKNEA